MHQSYCHHLKADYYFSNSTPGSALFILYHCNLSAVTKKTAYFIHVNVSVLIFVTKAINSHSFTSTSCVSCLQFTPVTEPAKPYRKYMLEIYRMLGTSMLFAGEIYNNRKGTILLLFLNSSKSSNKY